MNIPLCKHFRIRGDMRYMLNTEEFITTIEKEFNLDFRTLSGWQELIKRVHIAGVQLKRRQLEAKARKKIIAHKLFLEFALHTPFEKTDMFARIGKKRRQLEASKKKIKPANASDDSSPEKDDDVKSEAVPYEASVEEKLELPSVPSISKQQIHKEQRTRRKTRVSSYVNSLMTVTSNLPTMICENKHKTISPTTSEDYFNTYSSLSTPSPTFAAHIDGPTLQLTKSVKCSPSEINVKYDSLSEQTMKFSVTNITKRCMHIRFKKIGSMHHFKYAYVAPSTPIRLYPGLPVVLRLVFKLMEYKVSLCTHLLFKVGHNVYSGTPDEVLYIPIISDYNIQSVTVSDVVTIPPLYPWQFKRNGKYPTADIEVSVNDGLNYHLHIVKPRSEFITCDPVINEDQLESPETYDYKVYIRTLVRIVVERALEAFLLERTYVPFFMFDPKLVTIPVHLTKIERTGCHNCILDFLFIHPRFGNICAKKRVKIFADILSHPIKIDPPNILMMTDSPVVHGFCSDTFKIINTSKLLTVFVKIKTTKEMDELFTIFPMEVNIRPATTEVFEVTFWTVDDLIKDDTYVLFAIKIHMSGFKPMFEDVPPFEYEIVAPCAYYYERAMENHIFRPHKIRGNAVAHNFFID